MTIIRMEEDGTMFLDTLDLEPYEFWGYTTHVQDVAFSGPRGKSSNNMEHKLYDRFRMAGIKCSEQNKAVFGIKDRHGKLWYIGFYDFRISVGLSVRSDDHVRAIRKPGEEDADFEVIFIDEQGSGMEFKGHLGKKVTKAAACCGNCTIIFGWLDDYTKERVAFTPEELKPLTGSAEKLLAERKIPPRDRVKEAGK